MGVFEDTSAKETTVLLTKVTARAQSCGPIARSLLCRRVQGGDTVWGVPTGAPWFGVSLWPLRLNTGCPGLDTAATKATHIKN